MNTNGIATAVNGPPANPNDPSLQRQVTEKYRWLRFLFWFFRLFSCVRVTADCYRDNSHWLITRVQGGCLEPKWQWPFWHPAAHPQINSCTHPSGGIVGDCGSASPSDINNTGVSVFWCIQTRNGPKRKRNGPKSSSLGWDGHGFVGMGGGGGGCKGCFLSHCSHHMPMICVIAPLSWPDRAQCWLWQGP